MSFDGSTWGRRVLLTGLSPVSTISAFVALVDLSNIPDEAIDTGAFSALNGGGDLRFSTDEDGVNQLPLDDVTFVTSSNPASRKCQLWIRFPTYSSTSRQVYMFYNKAGEVQPPTGSPFGRDEVHQDFALVLHLESFSNPIDSTGNAIMSDVGTPVGTIGKIEDGASLTTSGYLTTDISQFDFTNGYSVSFWADMTDIGPLGPIIALNLPLFSIVNSNTPGEGRLFHNSIAVQILNFTSAFTIGTLKKYDLVWDETDGSFVIYSNGVLTSASATLITPPIASPNCFIFRRTTRRINADILDEYTFRNGKKSQAYVSSGFDNQNSPAIFWITGTPTTPGGIPVGLICFIGMTSEIDSENIGMDSSIDSDNIGMESNISATIGFISNIDENLGAISAIDAQNTGMISVIDDSKIGMVSDLCQF